MLHLKLNKNKRGIAFVIGFLVGILIIVGAICLDAFVLKLLVNWILTLFKVNYSIEFLQSLAVVILLWFVGSFFKNSKN